MVGKKPILGLCGGIGAGKTAVAAEFERQGCVRIDSDKLSHAALERAEVVRTLREWWGEGVIGAENRPNRKAIAERIFSDPPQKRRLEELLYPLIAAERTAIISSVVEDPSVKAIILDSPLLLESNLDRLCDAIVFVEASEQTRLSRLARSRGWTEAELRRRERFQWPVAAKRAKADFVIRNEGPGELVAAQVGDILEKVQAGFSRTR